MKIDPNAPAYPWHQSPGNQDNLGMPIRLAVASEQLAGLLAAESEDSSFRTVYTDPNTGGGTFSPKVYELKPDGSFDYTKPAVDCAIRLTRYQAAAQEAVKMADALIRACNEEDTR